MSFFTSRPATTSSLVIMRYPFAFTLTIVCERFGTEKPMWLTVVPFVPPVGAFGVKNTSTFGNLTISMLFVPTFTAVPPSTSAKNFFCASMLETFR